MRSRMNGKLWKDLTEAEHQQFPGDYEAQVGQGPITFHSEEHFATSDKGIALLRRLLEAQLKALAEGRDPAGTAFTEAEAYVRFDAGNYLVEEAAAAK